MADTGLGDLFYVGGNDLSGDASTVTLSGGPTLVAVTNLTQNAHARTATTFSGEIDFTVFFNPAATVGLAPSLALVPSPMLAPSTEVAAGEHLVLKVLPSADVIGTYVHGSSATAPAAGLVARQPDYKPTRGADGSLTFAVELQSDGSPLEWGHGYVGGPARTDTGPTAGAGVDDGNPTSSGLSAYLHVLAFTGSSVTALVEHSADNGVSDAWTTAVSFTAVNSAPVAQRVTTNASPMKRWLRVRTTGTFSNFKFYVMASRLAGLIFASTGVAVDIQVFTSSGTWTKPAGVTAVYVAALGGGGGGGAGACSAGACSGGSGGGGAAYVSNTFRAVDLGVTETVTVGAGGSSAPGRSTSGPGAGGGVGSSSVFGTTPKLVSTAGNSGNGGLGVLASGGTGGLGNFNGGAGGNGNVGADGDAALNIFGLGAAGGGGGGGCDATPNDFNGAPGGDCQQLNFAGAGAAGPVGNAGGDGVGAAFGVVVGGPGGGGGGALSGGAAGAGGAGGSWGAGGGGGGATHFGAGGTSGAGGRGAGGIVLVVSW